MYQREHVLIQRGRRSGSDLPRAPVPYLFKEPPDRVRESSVAARQDVHIQRGGGFLECKEKAFEEGGIPVSVTGTLAVEVVDAASGDGGLNYTQCSLPT